MKSKRLIVPLLGLLASVLTLAVMFQSVSPLRSSPFVVVFVFVLIFCCMLSLFMLIIHGLTRAFMWQEKTYAALKQYAVISAIGFVVLLALGTIGGFGLLDVILVGIFVALLAFFIRRQAGGSS